MIYLVWIGEKEFNVRISLFVYYIVVGRLGLE